MRSGDLMLSLRMRLQLSVGQLVYAIQAACEERGHHDHSRFLTRLCACVIITSHEVRAASGSLWSIEHA